MPALRNPRHEAFAREIAKGCSSASTAYAKAGYSKDSAHNHAYRLVANSGVQARIAELQQDFAIMAGVTKDSITQELEEARELARRLDKPDVMAKASETKARLHGLLVERKESGAPGDFKTVEERYESIARSLKVLEEHGVLPGTEH